MPTARRCFAWLFVAVFLPLASCATYKTPGRAADFQALGITKQEQLNRTDTPIEVQMARKPAASFPAAIAIVRVQEGGYTSQTYRTRGPGRFTVVGVREAESSVDMQKLAALPQIRGLAPLNTLVLPKQVDREMDLRMAAASVQADVLLLYTFETQFYSDTTVPVLGIITLGLFPNEMKRVTSTASAVFVDTRTGYVYGLCEATAKTDRLHNAWTSAEALENARLAAERDAFAKLADEMGKTWMQIAAEYGPRVGSIGTPHEAK